MMMRLGNSSGGNIGLFMISFIGHSIVFTFVKPIGFTIARVRSLGPTNPFRLAGRLAGRIAEFSLYRGSIQANLAIMNLDMKTRRYGKDLLSHSCTQVKYPGYSETKDSEENTGPNKLNRSETILAIVKLVVCI